MTERSALSVKVIGIAAVLWLALAPAVLADTCCANLPVALEPSSADPGDTVRLMGMECRNADNSGPLVLNLGAYWLATTKRPAEPDTGTVPGVGLPAELPPTEEWLPFDTVPSTPTAASGDATIVVPDLPDGRYQVWWWCDDGSGPGGGIHYSTGPRLVVGDPPDTSTAPAVAPEATRTQGLPAGLVVALGAAVLILSLRYPFGRRRGRD